MTRQYFILQVWYKNVIQTPGTISNISWIIFQTNKQTYNGKSKKHFKLFWDFFDNFLSLQFFVSALALGLIGAISATGYSSGGDMPSSVNSPIFSHHHVNVNKVAGNIERNPIPDIVISSGPVAIKMIFQSESTVLDASQNHKNTAASSQSSNSQDGEIVLKHSVTKPVTQYVSEEIIPSRFLSQKVLPVKEHVKTIVTKNVAGGKPEPEPYH